MRCMGSIRNECMANDWHTGLASRRFSTSTNWGLLSLQIEQFFLSHLHIQIQWPVLERQRYFNSSYKLIENELKFEFILQEL